MIGLLGFKLGGDGKDAVAMRLLPRKKQSAGTLLVLAIETSADKNAEQIAEDEAAKEMGGHSSGSGFDY